MAKSEIRHPLVPMGRLPFPAFALALALACSKASAPAGVDEEGPPQPAPAGVLVRRLTGECSVVPCPSGKCRVVCPPEDQTLRIDVTEPLLGNITILVDGVAVFSKYVPAMPTTGLAASVGVRPLRWPAEVEVRVDERSGRTRVERQNRYVATRGRNPGPIGFAASAEGFTYE